MTATKNAEAQQEGIYRVFIAAPIENVWSELVRTDRPLPFLFGAVCATENGLQTGAPMAMRSSNGKYTSVVGEVLEFEPPYRYSHTFKFTNYDDPPCTVTYVLKEVEGGVEFTLTTTNVPADTKTEKSMAQGGPFIVKTLKSVVETGRASFGGRFLLGLIAMMAPFSPKICESENWTFQKIRTLTKP